MMARRGFLGRMLAAPFAAKAMGEAAIAEAAKVQVGPEMLSADFAHEIGVPVGSSLANGSHSRALDYLKSFGLPDFELDRLRDESRRVYALDPDIANKCWSMAVKVQHQRQRQFERAVAEYARPQAYQLARAKFIETMGFWLGW